MSRRLSILAASLLLTAAATAQAASPRLSIILPRGVQRGKEHVLTFSGSNLGDAEEIFFYEQGFEVTKVEGSGNSCKATVKVAPEVRLGEHVAQVRTKTGISDYRTFYVGALPAVDEVEPNSVFEKPQAIAMNVTVAGVVASEDVDYFIVDAKKGQRISAEVEAMRLGTTLFDPYVAILDAKRFELSSGDDTPLVLQDSVASVVAPEDGKYIIEIRESAYGGNGNCRYRAHIGNFPRPTAVFPAGGKQGEEVAVRYLGVPGGEFASTVKVPTEENNEFGVYATDDGGVAPSPNPFRISDQGNTFEKEPNNAIAEATPVEFPSSFNGIIEAKGDIDCFKFAAKKGQVYEVECYARRVRSALDPVMNLYQADGKGITGNDDSRGPDSYFRFSVPADGEYVIRVTDHLGRGGQDFVYRVEFQALKPRLSLSIPRVERYGQYRQQVYVPRGNRFATLINAGRANFGGELVLDSSNLPKGIKMHAMPMPANMSTMPVVFEAEEGAELNGALLDFIAKLNDPKQNIGGKFRNTADFIIAGPGQSRYRTKSVSKLAMAVIDTIPFKLEIAQPKAPIVRNGSMQLKVIAHRAEGFKGAINVTFPFRPPGIGGASSVNIAADKNEVLYPLSANGGAAIGEWPVYALGSSGGNWSSSQLAKLKIAGPFVTFEMQRASCEQGQPVQVYCKMNHAAPFEGTARVQLLGLPPKVVTKDLEITKDTKELVFELTTDPTSPAGKYKNVFCQVTITDQGEAVVSRAGGTELQIDKPLPMPTKPKPAPAKVAAKPEPAKPMAKPPKPLTRLEKLRLAAKERREAKAAAAAAGGGEEEE
ncbi:MAG: PPC domain-containing protein [Pirellulaceae bacterium]|nr:PPC domain-containing protein [Pirellulaceae bacterium]MDP7015020.1 PPC domain-containing protein [Pirellulaceae bacterium]